MYKILVINPGSTSTKIALFDDETALFMETVRHSQDVISAFENVQAQLDFRTAEVERALAERGVAGFGSGSGSDEAHGVS